MIEFNSMLLSISISILIYIYIYVSINIKFSFVWKFEKGGKTSTSGQIKKTVSGKCIFTDGSKTTAIKNTNFYWPLALVALKNASANSFRTATIEFLSTSCTLKFLRTI
jgi:hypothetical protein